MDNLVPPHCITCNCVGIGHYLVLRSHRQSLAPAVVVVVPHFCRALPTVQALTGRALLPAAVSYQVVLLSELSPLLCALRLQGITWEWV